MFRFFREAEFGSPALVMCWDDDSGRVAPQVARCLIEQFNAAAVCDIRPADFFALSGVAMENDIARFPQTRLYYSRDKDLLILQSTKPQFQHSKFLTAVLDLAEHYCKIREFFTVDGIAASIAHGAERRILAVFNNKEFQKQLRPYNLQNMDYEGLPAVSSYLLWMAKDRNITAASLWPQVPFYVASSKDPQAVKAVVAFFNDRFRLDFDFKALDERIERQNEKIARLREENPELDESLRNLESGLSLSQQEQIALINAVSKLKE